MSAPQKSAWVQCNRCNQKTKHDVVCSHPDPWVEEDTDGPTLVADGAIESLACCGCREVTIRKWQGTGHPNSIHETLLPPRHVRRVPDWMPQIDEADTQGLMGEIYSALDAKLPRLAMMGCRAVIDVVLVRKVGDVGSFQKKLGAAVTKGVITEEQKRVLDAAIDAGNASSHRAFNPSASTLDQVVTIVEHLVQSTLLGDVADQVRRETPKRKA